MSKPPSSIRTLVGRYDPSVFDARRRLTRVRLAVRDGGAWDVVLSDDGVELGPADGTPDAVLTADVGTWRMIATDVRGGMGAY